jgi:glycerophosphoryl diester phosphodiesterase
MKRAPLLPERERPLLFAHRGASSLAPENTFAAFRKAQEIGAMNAVALGIELDVHLSLDGRLVVSHDGHFRRSAPHDTIAAGRTIEEMPWIDIQRIDVGGGEHPPLLEEVLEEFCPELFIDIELKSNKMYQDELPFKTAQLIRSMGPGIAASLSVSSFNPISLVAFKAALPNIPTAIIWSVGQEIPLPLRHGFGCSISQCDYLKPELTQTAREIDKNKNRRKAYPLVPWTVDSVENARWVLGLGCAGLISNRPQDLVPLISKGR